MFKKMAEQILMQSATVIVGEINNDQLIIIIEINNKKFKCKNIHYLSQG